MDTGVTLTRVPASIFLLSSGAATPAREAGAAPKARGASVARRLGSDYAALLIIVLTMMAGAHAADSRAIVERGCVYDYRMITDQECRAYRTSVLKARSNAERIALLNDLEKVIAARATERGVPSGDWRGLELAPLRTSTSK